MSAARRSSARFAATPRLGHLCRSRGTRRSNGRQQYCRSQPNQLLRIDYFGPAPHCKPSGGDRRHQSGLEAARYHPAMLSGVPGGRVVGGVGGGGGVVVGVVCWCWCMVVVVRCVVQGWPRSALRHPPTRPTRARGVGSDPAKGRDDDDRDRGRRGSGATSGSPPSTAIVLSLRPSTVGAGRSR